MNNISVDMTRPYFSLPTDKPVSQGDQTERVRAVRKYQDAIRMNLLDHMMSQSGRRQILDDIECNKITKDNLKIELLETQDFELNSALLWAAFLKRCDLLSGLLDLGADIGHYEPYQGLTALHLAAFSSCTCSSRYLIAKGANINASSVNYTPLHCAILGNSPEVTILLINHSANVHAIATSLNLDNVLHIRVNRMTSIRLNTGAGAVIETKYTKMHPIHLAATVGHFQCLVVLLNVENCDVNAEIPDGGYTALHLAVQGNYLDCIELLLERQVDANAKSYKGETPLELAVHAKNYDCVELLLRKGEADPNIPDTEQGTLLHAAVSDSIHSHNIIDCLIKWGANIDVKDQDGYTPLHKAALYELPRCVEVLIFHGADVTANLKLGMTALGIITRRTPASLGMIRQGLDAAITYINPTSFNDEVKIQLDFDSILQHSHTSEISFLNTFVDEGQKQILLHPLCAAFLYLKWRKIRKYYIIRIIFYLIFIVILSLYLLTALAYTCINKEANGVRNLNETYFCKNESAFGNFLRENSFTLSTQWCLLVTITIVDIFRKIFGIAGYPNFKQYLSNPGNAIEWSVIISACIIAGIDANQTYTGQNHVGAFAILFGWTNLMLMMGQLPIFRSYVSMYTSIQGEFAKLLLAYSSLLIGFTIGFCLIFSNSQLFANPFMGFTTVMVMMTGELQLDLLEPKEMSVILLEISAEITFIIFTLFVSVVLMNLLVGIAVQDIQGLQKTAELSRLVRQMKLISHIELALFNRYLPKCLLSLFERTALMKLEKNSAELIVEPLNPKEKQLPKDILKTAFEIGKKRKNMTCPITSRDTSAKKTPNKSIMYDMIDSFNENDVEYNNSCELVEKMDNIGKDIEDLKGELRNLRSDLNAIIHLLYKNK